IAFVREEVAWCHAIVLDVVDVEPESSQADEVVHRLPDDARDWVATHHPEDGDAGAGPAIARWRRHGLTAETGVRASTSITSDEATTLTTTEASVLSAVSKRSPETSWR